MSRKSVSYKTALLAITIALSLASFSTLGAFALTPSKTSGTSSAAVTQNLANNWKAETSALRVENAVFNGFDRLLDGSRKHARLDGERTNMSESKRVFVTFDYILNKADTIASTHAGFDANGQVTDQTQANKSAQELRVLMSQLRGELISRLRNAFS